MNSPAKQTSQLAIASLISGILGWTLVPFLGALVAIVTGHMARKEIRNNPEAKEGDGMALAGIILGWSSIALWIIGILLFGGLILATFGLLFTAANGGH